MANLSEILAGKRGDVVRIEGDASVYEAVRRMVEANVGAVLVTNGGAVEGIFTERDYLRRIAAEELHARETRVRDVMSSPVIVVTPETTVDEGMALMTDRRIRHAPVVADGQLVGMISIGDLVKFTTKAQSFQIQYLQDYITAR